MLPTPSVFYSVKQFSNYFSPTILNQFAANLSAGMFNHLLIDHHTSHVCQQRISVKKTRNLVISSTEVWFPVDFLLCAPTMFITEMSREIFSCWPSSLLKTSSWMGNSSTRRLKLSLRSSSPNRFSWVQNTTNRDGKASKTCDTFLLSRNCRFFLEHRGQLKRRRWPKLRELFHRKK